MANVRWLTTALAAVAIFGVMAAPALAGGGVGIGGGLAYQCYLISDPSPGQELSVTDLISGARTVKLGNARLFCNLASGTITAGSQNPSFLVPPPQDEVPNFLKCYEVRSSAGDNPEDILTLRDVFQDEIVPVGGAKFICVVAVEP